MRTLCIGTAAFLLLSSAACASGGGGAPRGNANVITAEELQSVSATNAYEAIQKLRPAYLRTRGAVKGASTASGQNSVEPIDLVVYFGENRMGGSESLKQISIAEIGEIRYYSASDATQKWGTGHSAGAIQVGIRH
jgi:hypothetical protein